jgi:hypothetical protein
MEYYYHVRFETWRERAGMFMESHFVPTDEEGIIFVVCKFRDKTDKWSWENVAGVEPLPHPEDPNGKIGEKHAARLKRYGVNAAHRTTEAAELAAKIHPLLRWGG